MGEGREQKHLRESGKEVLRTDIITKGKKRCATKSKRSRNIDKLTIA